MDGCHCGSRLVERLTPAARELVVSGKQHPRVRTVAQLIDKRPILQPFKTQLSYRDGFPSAVSKFRIDSRRQALVDNDFQHRLCGSEIRIDGFKPGNRVVDLSRFEVEVFEE